MTESSPSADAPAGGAQPAHAAEPAPSSGGFSFTDDGCRLELQVGGLLVVACVFLWQFLPGITNGGMSVCAFGWLIGALLIVVGAPIQAWQARTAGRPGYPWKLGLALVFFGGFMLWDLRYREVPSGPLILHQTALMMVSPGLWILLWWPLARTRLAGTDGD